METTRPTARNIHFPPLSLFLLVEERPPELRGLNYHNYSEVSHRYQAKMCNYSVWMKEQHFYFPRSILHSARSSLSFEKFSILLLLLVSLFIAGGKKSLGAFAYLHFRRFDPDATW